MNNKDIALEVLKLTYRHDQKPEDLIERSKPLIDFIFKCQTKADITIKKSDKPSVI